MQMFVGHRDVRMNRFLKRVSAYSHDDTGLGQIFMRIADFPRHHLSSLENYSPPS